MADLRQFKCTSCGGSLQFDSNSQQITCPYCGAIYGKEFFEQMDADLQENHQNETNWDEVTHELYSEEEAKGMTVYSCDACGGEILCGENTSATICPYCGSAVLIRSKIAGDLKPELIIPFKLDKEKSNEAFRAFFKKKFFIPNAFKKENKIQESSSLYVPYWIYGADSDGQAVFHGEIVHRWSDGDYNYKEVNNYKLYRSGNIAFDNIPVDASKKMPDDLMESIEPFNAADHEKFVSGYLSGFAAERYDVSKEENQKRANTRIYEGTMNALRNTTGGYSDVRLIHGQVQTSNHKCQYVLYPIWMLNVKWRDATYTFAVNGDTGKVAGKYPISKLKFILVLLLSLIALFGIGFGLGFLFREEESLVIPLLVGLAFGVIGTLIIGLVLGRKLKKRVSLKNGAADYVRPGSFDLYEKRDVFISKNVYKTKIVKSDSNRK